MYADHSSILCILFALSTLPFLKGFFNNFLLIVNKNCLNIRIYSLRSFVYISCVYINNNYFFYAPMDDDRPGFECFRFPWAFLNISSFSRGTNSDERIIINWPGKRITMSRALLKQQILDKAFFLII